MRANRGGAYLFTVWLADKRKNSERVCANEETRIVLLLHVVCPRPLVSRVQRTAFFAGGFFFCVRYYFITPFFFANPIIVLRDRRLNVDSWEFQIARLREIRPLFLALSAVPGTETIGSPAVRGLPSPAPDCGNVILLFFFFCHTLDRDWYRHSRVRDRFGDLSISDSSHVRERGKTDHRFSKVLQLAKNAMFPNRDWQYIFIFI